MFSLLSYTNINSSESTSSTATTDVTTAATIYTGAISAKHSHSPDSALSEPPPHPTKRRRTSLSHSQSDSSLSDDEEDEEDRPLAARIPISVNIPTSGGSGGGKVPASPTRTRARAGKKGPSHAHAHGPGMGMKAMSIKVPAEQPHSVAEALQLNGRGGPSVGVNGNSGRSRNGEDRRVKLEEKIDGRQLSRLATGITVDTGVTAPTPVSHNSILSIHSLNIVVNIFCSCHNLQVTAKPEKMVYVEMRQGIIRVMPVGNDGQPQSLIILTGLKTLFQKQLPKMPREYIARLVYDTNSKALAIVKHGLKVVGGICYRPFPQRGFAEIVFFATASVDQVKVGGSIFRVYSLA